ncbi:hypothetical protein ACJBZ2_11190, partial [Streptococcus suis]
KASQTGNLYRGSKEFCTLCAAIGGDTCFSPYFLKRKDTVVHKAVSCLLYRQLVFLLLLRRARKNRFLISNFKNSTGVFELDLPD